MMERPGAAEAVERARAGLEEELRLYEPVSYTHLTLPTIYSV